MHLFFVASKFLEHVCSFSIFKKENFKANTILSIKPMETFGTCDPKGADDFYMQQSSYYSYQKGLN